MGMGVFRQKEPKNARRPLNWRSHFRPQSCRRKFYGRRAFSEHSKNGHARFRNKHSRNTSVSQRLLKAKVESVLARFKERVSDNAFKHSYAVKHTNRLHPLERVPKNTSVSEFRVDPSNVHIGLKTLALFNNRSRVNRVGCRGGETAPSQIHRTLVIIRVKSS